MKLRILLVTILTLSLIPLTTHAMVPVTCFDHEFVRGKGKPITKSLTFPGIAGPATIKLENDRISSATVSVNGTEVFDPSDFNQNVDYLEAEVMLTEGNTNTIEVTLKSKPEGSVRILLEQLVDAHAAMVFGITGGVLTTETGAVNWVSNLD